MVQIVMNRLRLMKLYREPRKIWKTAQICIIYCSPKCLLENIIIFFTMEKDFILFFVYKQMLNELFRTVDKKALAFAYEIRAVKFVYVARL